VSVSGWSLMRFVHVLAAMGWVGGQLLLSAVVLPVLRQGADPAVRGPLIRQTARRFGGVAKTVLLPTLVVSGVALAWHRGVRLESLGDPGYGRLLAFKLVLVVVSVALAAVHGVTATKWPGSARPLAIAGLASSIGIVVFATALVPRVRNDQFPQGRR
jgi:putative copper export protein